MNDSLVSMGDRPLVISPLVNIKWIQGTATTLSPLTGEVLALDATSFGVLVGFSSPARIAEEGAEAATRDIAVRLFEQGLLIPAEHAEARRELGPLDLSAQFFVNHECGYHRSLIQWAPLRRGGKPMPWMSYAVTAFFDQLDLRDCSVFEFGSGYSSLYWAERAKDVVTVETELEWVEKLRPHAPPNLTLLHRGDTQEFSRAIHEDGRQYDLVVVDGMPRTRVACLPEAILGLKADGILVLDDSNYYPEAVRLLMTSGFVRADYFGLTPAESAVVQMTSVFFRGQCGVPMHLPPRSATEDRKELVPQR
jgi:hypothetical protein